MSITHNITIPGLTTSGIEFFVDEAGELRVLCCRKEIDFYSLPEFAYKTIKRKMGNPDAALEDMRSFTIENWGGMDDMDDIDECGNPGKSEYVDGLSTGYFDNGKKISEGQLRVIKLLHLDSSNAIGDVLFISPQTVSRHLQDIYNETGFKSRTQLALWAKNNGIIK